MYQPSEEENKQSLGEDYNQDYNQDYDQIDQNDQLQFGQNEEGDLGNLEFNEGDPVGSNAHSEYMFNEDENYNYERYDTENYDFSSEA